MNFFFFSIWWKNLTGYLNIRVHRGVKRGVASIQDQYDGYNDFHIRQGKKVSRVLRRYPEHAFNGSTGIPDQFSFPLGRGKISTTEAKREDRVGNVWRGINGRRERNGWSLLSFSIAGGSVCDGVTRFDLTDV